MNSFDILSKSTTLQPRLFLEASAGTGKTFTIQHLVVRLLLETSMNLEEIVIVTFTRAATRELKDRIRSNLEEILEQKTAFSYLENISPAQRMKIEDAFKNFETSQIFTIHGFCLHLLKQFAFVAGVSLDLTEWTREEELWEVREFLRSQTSISSGELQRLLNFYRSDIGRLEEALIRSSEEKQIEPITIPNIQHIKPFALSDEFETIRSSYKGMTSEEFSSQACALGKALYEGKISPSLWNAWISQPAFFLKNLTDSNLKVRAKAKCSQALAELRDRVVPALESAQNPARIFKILSHAWYQRRREISEREGKITPDDLLKIVHSKLENPAFVNAVRKKYKAAIVDEFQDTDPLQWDIFKTLFMEEPSHSVYLVGDPKQSIYAFRSADIYTFLNAAKSFGFEQKAALTRNFRSTAGLLKQMNQLLSASQWMDLPKQGIFLDVPPALAAKEGEGHLCFMVAQGEMGRSSRFPTEEMEEGQFFPFIAHEIIHKQIDPSSIAILVKDRFQAERVKNYLNRYNIPTTLYRSAPINKSPVIEYLEELIDATLTLSTSAIKKLLLGPFASIPYHVLTPETVYRAKEDLQTLKQLWLLEDFASFFGEFLNTTFGKKSALITFYLETEHYHDLLEITQKILFAQTPYHLQELLREIKLFETEDRLSSHAQGVQIMTTHASKGLEFETVFALGLASRSPQAELSEEQLKELDAEKMRQFYVAVTRAAKRLYIPIAQELPSPSYEIGEGSPVELFFSKAKPDLSTFEQIFLYERSFSFDHPRKNESSYYLPPLKLQNPLPQQYIHSFTSLSQDNFTIAKGDDQGIDPGKESGILIHRILERYFNQEGSLETLCIEETKNSHLINKQHLVAEMLQKALNMPLGPFSLSEVDPDNMQTEVEFLYTAQEGWMRGFIDLYFEFEGKAYVVDWKTNLLENGEPQTIENMMKTHDYILQGEIYKEAVEKFSPLPFGGAYFIFIRGPAFYVVGRSAK